MVVLNSYNDKLTVKDLRTTVGLKQTELAKLIGYHKCYMPRFDKKDISQLRVSQLLKLSKALNGKLEVRFELPSGHFLSLGEKDNADQ